MYSIRSYTVNNESHLIAVGCMHKVGQAKSNQDHIDSLLDFVKAHFKVTSVTHTWGGQNYKPADMLPYIGEKNKGSRQYVATGFSTDGLIYGTLAAMIISDGISGAEHPYYELFKASRHQPLKAAKNVIKENLNVAYQLLQDFTVTGIANDVEDLRPGEGKIVQKGAKKIAVHKDTNGNLNVLSPICPHMGCIVHWNNAEESWDCPCHGSRFDCTGNIIEGPAFHGLERKST